jgi:secreted Zn-dependent insulinase-like peptidase
LKDNKFERPKLIVNKKIYTNDCLWTQKPESRVFVMLWQKVLQEYMREFNYNAEEARLDFSIDILDDHIKLKWSGFNDAMPQYIDETLTRIVKMKDENLAQIFEQAKEKLLQDWKNFYLDQTYKQIRPTLECVLMNLNFEKKHLRSHLEKFSHENFTEYLKDWLKTGRSLWYICGNYSDDKCIKLVEDSRKKFDLSSIKIEELPELRIIALEEKTSFHI